MDNLGRSQKETPKMDERIAENYLEFPGKILEKIIGEIIPELSFGVFF